MIPKPAAAFVALLLAAGAASAGGHNVSMRSDPRFALDDCRQIIVEFGDSAAARAEEERTVPGSAELVAHLPSSSGIRVFGWGGPDYSVKACKAAASEDLLRRVSVSVEGGRLSADGPRGRDGDWLVYFLVQAPRSAALNLSAENGPVGVRGVSGSVHARTTNGPLSFEECSGEIEAQATNGPISLVRSTGEVEAHAENGPIEVSESAGSLRVATRNGPITVQLAGLAWEGKGLDARAVNGPLTIRVPEGYRSGVRVEALGHSPFECKGEPCRAARKDFDEDGRSIELGHDPVVVRLSTVNGPVSVRPAD